ncbi:RT0821/Lpp0805 family surface protein [Stappia indica]|uniref:RT0821/Lpp0805 family surface protein n=1 Tax=Stappia indica TaxID=538381 RepID=UPI001CD5A990|nr:RT0821/Lpp0805 family surface protein [Stappia indica]MCA1297880.1 pyridoxamine 5-phosphate oxidase [Stappia indica]
MQCKQATYTVFDRLRQPQLALLISCALLTSACSGVSMPVGSADVEVPLDLTGSIDAQQNAADVDIGQEDRVIIARTIAEASDGERTAPPLSWNNPITGNSGTILSLVQDKVTGGTGCSRFETTANTIGGVRAYHGVACRDAMQDWAVIELKTSPAPDSDA